VNHRHRLLSLGVILSTLATLAPMSPVQGQSDPSPGSPTAGQEIETSAPEGSDASIPGTGVDSLPEEPGSESPLPEAEVSDPNPDPVPAGAESPSPEAEVADPNPDPVPAGAEPPSPEAEVESPVPSSPSAPTPETSGEREPEVLVAEVVVSGVGEALQDLVYDAIQTRPGRTATRSQLQEDINTIFALGVFASARVVPEDTPLGVRVTFAVVPNPTLTEVQLTSNVLPQNFVGEVFEDQYGKTLNFQDLQDGIQQINEWYQDNGYVLAQVLDAPQVSDDGVVTLDLAEGVVESIEVRFLSDEGEVTDEAGESVDGRTRDFIIAREMQLKPGDVFNRDRVQADLQRVFGLGVFQDVRLSLNPGEDPRQVVVMVDVIERRTGSLAFGAGVSSASGLFGSLSYQERNLGGNNQTLGAEIQAGQRELLADVRFTDPWVAGSSSRLSYTVNGSRRRSISLIFDNGDDEVELPDGDRPRINRLGGGVTFTRPINPDPFARSDWSASAGIRYQRVKITNSDGDTSPRDELGNLLSFTDDGKDDLYTVRLDAVRDRRNNPLLPTRGSFLQTGLEQSLPIGDGSILLTRLRGSYSHYIPIRIIRFSKGCRQDDPAPGDCPQALAFNVQGGTVLGDLPPYEAFSIGGGNSVRGFDEGDVGSGKSFLQATAEYRFPFVSIVSGALFVDAGTDLGTGNEVPGNPAGIRGKPGSGVGYGFGLRVQSPLGPIRVDLSFNGEGGSRVHFGVGERF